MTVQSHQWCIRVWLATTGFVALWAGLVGCSDRIDHPGPAEASASAFRMGPDETPFARVDGRDISVDELMSRWRQTPDQQRQTLVDSMVERDIAAHRLFEKDPFEKSGGQASELRRDLELARKSSMVRELLEVEIESSVTVEDLEEASVDERMDTIRRQVGRPRGMQVSHLLVSVPDDAEEPFDEARRWAERIRGELGEVAHLQDLYDMAERFQAELPDRLEFVIDPHLVFPAESAEKRSADLPGDWSRVVAPFREAASALVADRTGPGSMKEAESGRTVVSEPVRTKYGWHLIVPERVLPAKRPEEAPLRELARRELLREKRRQRLQSWVADLAARTDIVRLSDNLSDDPE